ncbi:MAG: hypothetical protein DMF92_09935 [Acidobacteria bacterium]|nr:MAG: hypothetical protein DMF92_09935 [Acidobacteriota bacterium]
MRGVSRILFAFAWMAIVPSALYAQASITGVVKDPSGAVLPGVTVEAASPALIEKVRSVVSDGTGQYRILDLRPGSYTVTFTLTGFSTVKREGIELTGSFTATVNADMRVGAVEETVTVTGETPISTTREQSITHDVIDTIPTGRLAQNLAVLLTGVSVGGGLTLNGVGTQDVGGTSGNAVAQLAAHGSRSLDQRTSVNGLSVMLSAGANNTPYVANMGSTQEVTIDISGVSAEAAEGGVRVNLIPKEGGNSFKGSMFASFGQQLYRRPQGSRLHDPQRPQEGHGPQSGVRRPDHEGQVVGLRVVSNAGRGKLGGGNVFRPHVQRSKGLGPQPGSEPSSLQRRSVERGERPLDVAGHGKEQVRVLFRERTHVHVPVCHPGDHLARVRQPLGMAAPFRDGRVERTRHESDVARSGPVPAIPELGLVPL